MSERLADRYELGERLGAGGMAEVVAAHDLVLDRPVAVKLLTAHTDPTARERFLAEARTAARVHHPNAVAVLDAGEHDGRPYLVMELVRGRTLADHLAAEGPLPVDEAVAVVLGVVDALAAAHGRELVHRDVKPANVLLPDEGGVKLADFGIAKALADATRGLTATGTVVGTVGYVAPEVVEGRRATPASDVYSTGCLLFELLTGRPPYTGGQAVSIAYAHVHEPVPRVADRRPDVPEEVTAVVQRALAKDPAARYADAAELRTALLEGPEAAASPAPTMPIAGVGVVAEDAHDRARTVPPDAADPGGGGGTVGDGDGGLPKGVGDAPTSDRAPTTTVGTGESRRPGRWAAVGLAVAALLAVLVALVGLERGWFDGAAEEPPALADDPAAGEPDSGPADEPTGPEPPAGEEAPPDEAGEPEAPEEQPGEGEGPGEPDAPEASEPSTLAELIAFLADAPPEAYGEAHDDLLDDLLALREEQDPEDRAEDAAALREDVATWVADGELNPAVGATADRILADLARS